MRRHNLFTVFHHTDYSTGSKIAKWMGREDWWDSMFYSKSTRVPEVIIDKVLELVSTTEDREVGHVSRSQGLNAARRNTEDELVTLIKGLKLDLDDSILVWHIATSVYVSWYKSNKAYAPKLKYAKESKQLSKYMFFLLAARPYMLPYPVTRQRYVQLCHDSVTHLRCCGVRSLRKAIQDQKDALMEGSPLQYGFIGAQAYKSSDTGTERPSINITLDKGSQLAAKLIHRAEQGNADGIMEMIFEVWVEMLCYTAYGCNEKSHAENLNNGGDIMTIVALMMAYMSNGFFQKTKISNKDTGEPTEERDTGAASTSGGTKKGSD